jgi:CxxC-x17-CxxC domain-containing protein
MREEKPRGESRKGSSESRSFGRGSEDKDRFGREMHNVKCSDCGADTKVPFKPSEDRPVYCRDCYQKHRPPRKRF